MKKLFVLLFFFALVINASVAFAQTRQQSKQIRALDQQISRLKLEKIRLERKIQPDYAEQIKSLNSEIKSLEIKAYDTANTPDLNEIAQLEQKINKKRDLLAFFKEKALNGQNNAQLINQIEEKNSKITFFEGEREKIFLKYTTENQMEREMTLRTKERRQRANVIRREEMVIQKVEKNLDSVNPTNSNGGYLVILCNQNYNHASFKISSMDGAEHTSHTLKGKTSLDVYLLPGKYLITSTVGGIKELNPIVIEITGEVKSLFGRECFGYALVSSAL